MALLSVCSKCGLPFTQSCEDYGGLCSDCDGSKEAEQAEEDRFNALSRDERIAEVRRDILAIQKRLELLGYPARL